MFNFFSRFKIFFYLFVTVQIVFSGPPSPWDKYYLLDSTRNNRVDNKQRKLRIDEDEQNLNLFIVESYKNFEEVVGLSSDDDKKTFQNLIGRGRWPILERDFLFLKRYLPEDFSNLRIVKTIKASKVTSHNTWMIWDPLIPKHGILFVKFLLPYFEDAAGIICEQKVRYSIAVNNIIYKLMEKEENPFSTYLPEFHAGLFEFSKILRIKKDKSSKPYSNYYFGFIVRSGNPLFRALNKNEILVPAHAELDPDFAFSSLKVLPELQLDWIKSEYHPALAKAKLQERLHRGFYGEDHAQNNLFIIDKHAKKITGVVNRDFYDLTLDPLIRFLFGKTSLLNKFPQELSILNIQHVDIQLATAWSLYANYEDELVVPRWPMLQNKREEVTNSWMNSYVRAFFEEVGVTFAEFNTGDIDTFVKRHLIYKRKKNFVLISKKIGTRIFKLHKPFRQYQIFTKNGEPIKFIEKDVEFIWDKRGLVIFDKRQNIIIGYIFDLSPEEIAEIKNSINKCALALEKF